MPINRSLYSQVQQPFFLPFSSVRCMLPFIFVWFHHCLCHAFTFNLITTMKQERKCCINLTLATRIELGFYIDSSKKETKQKFTRAVIIEIKKWHSYHNKHRSIRFGHAIKCLRSPISHDTHISTTTRVQPLSRKSHRFVLSPSTVSFSVSPSALSLISVYSLSLSLSLAVGLFAAGEKKRIKKYWNLKIIIWIVKKNKNSA